MCFTAEKAFILHACDTRTEHARAPDIASLIRVTPPFS
jgi:hypothetical protein